jgi:hypothetical protein
MKSKSKKSVASYNSSSSIFERIDVKPNETNSPRVVNLWDEKSLKEKSLEEKLPQTLSFSHRPLKESAFERIPSEPEIIKSQISDFVQKNNREIIKAALKESNKLNLAILIRQIAISNLWPTKTINAIDNYMIDKLIAQHFDMRQPIIPQVYKMIETIYIHYMMAQQYKYVRYAAPNSFKNKAVNLLDAPNELFPIDAPKDFFDNDNINGLSPSIRFALDVKSYYKQMPQLRQQIQLLSSALLKFNRKLDAITLHQTRQSIMATNNHLLIQFYNNCVLSIRFL